MLLGWGSLALAANRGALPVRRLKPAPIPGELGTTNAAWARVEKAVSHGLPRTAIKELEPIIHQALADKAWAEAAKAITQRITLEAQIQGNGPETKITRLQAELAHAPAPLQPIFQTVLAEWYWQYFRGNQGRFLQRTPTTEAPGPDFTTWGLPRLFAEIERHFSLALAAEKQLKATPIGDYNDFLVKGTLPDRYRPTLYDFVAFQALSFYTSGAQAAAQPEEVFTVSANSDVFAPADQFIAWHPQTTDTNSVKLKAIHLYQALLRFHRTDSDRSAFLDDDLQRLVWAWNVASGEDKDARFKAALESFAQQHADNDLASMALYQWARLLDQEGHLAAAHRVASRGRTIHPESPGGKLCANIQAQLEAKSANYTTERIWNRPWPKIEVEYKNVTNVFFRLVRWDWDKVVESGRVGSSQGGPSTPNTLTSQERQALLARSPDYAWSQALPPTTDFKMHQQLVPVPTDLSPGFYFLISSHKADFKAGDNQMTIAPIWVSDLAVVVRTQPGEINGFVLHADSGEPIAGATVRVWSRDHLGRLSPMPARRTDANGFFRLPPSQRGYLIEARSGGQELGMDTSGVYVGPPRAPKPFERTVLFTDRAIYRPGQTVQYKGICLRADRAKDNYHVLSGQTLTLVFYDANGKEIARRSERCNDYGSFAGSFTAPSDRLTGRMRLQVIHGPSGTAWIRVEEYKRPKFQVTLDAPKEAAKLGGRVVLQGHAMSYNGAPVDGATVQYHVVRQSQIPWWWHWRGSTSQDIAHGTTRTATDGSFRIEFTAQPDRSVPAKYEPVFTFAVTADVTDPTGETRSGQRSLPLGYTALKATLTAANWETASKPVAVHVHTETLDGESAPAEGVVKVYQLKAPAHVQRPAYTSFEGVISNQGSETDNRGLSNPESWPLGPVVEQKGFSTDHAGNAVLHFSLPAGEYRAVLETQDRFGKSVTCRLPLRVLEPAASHLALRIPNLLAAPKWSVEPGEEFTAVWGTGYPSGRAYVEVEHRHRLLQHYWTAPGVTLVRIKQAVTAGMRGGFTLRVTFVHENRAYIESRHVDVPWSNKRLTIQWQHFTSKLKPDQKETWTAVIKGSDAKRHVAEMVATLYDASLDAFVPLRWPHGFGVFRQDRSVVQSQFSDGAQNVTYFAQFNSPPNQLLELLRLRYRSFPLGIGIIRVFATGSYGGALGGFVLNGGGYGGLGGGFGPMNTRRMMRYGLAKQVAPSAALPAPAFRGTPVAAPVFGFGQVGAGSGQETKPAPILNLNQVSARKNLNETAFFFPQLLANSNGVVRLTFTMPEALTEWHFMAFAHDRQLRSGFLDAKVVTSKDLMVQPNAPRFLRVGDTIAFTVKVINRSDHLQQGKVRLTFNNLFTDKPADAALGNDSPERAFAIPAHESRTFAWRIHVPAGLTALSYKAVAATPTLSDGEEGAVPVLSQQVLVTESLPLPIRGPATNSFTFQSLLDSGQSKTLHNQGLTVEMASNPAWYAVMALPYLMECPYECNEQTFNRYYADQLARFIAHSNPRIRRIFNQWKATPALKSPLEKDQALKNILIEETPWVRQAESETQARHNIGVLFDENRLDYEMNRALRKLRDAQLPNGLWPWFPGGRGNDYITLYIATGFGRLRHLGVDVPVQAAVRALDQLDRWIENRYDKIKQHEDPAKDHMTPLIAFYLYGRSFFLKDKPIAPACRAAVDYFLKQGRQYWVQLGDRQSQGHLALAFERFGDHGTAVAIVKSLKERSVTSPELGRFWREPTPSWWWYRAPIETQALMIECFHEITHDTQAVEQCQIWLLKQKQTQAWRTTKATADAVYALLLRGADLLASDQLVTVTLGDHEIKPSHVEAGTGFYEQRFSGPEVKPSLGHITARKRDRGIAWGSVNWQYLENLSAVKPYAGTPLKLQKTLYVKKETDHGPVLEPVHGPLAVGDELVVRLVLRVDRAMEFVHLKDERGSGTEPVSVLSGYHYQDGLSYYETTHDTATHFFIGTLPPGTYVFQYPVRVQLRGEYQSGIASIQCMYAPEFNSHSQSYRLVVR